MTDQKITFKYDLDKDIWCISNKGAASNNSAQPTKIYQLLIEQYGTEPTNTDISDFISGYLQGHDIAPEESISSYEADWSKIGNEYHRRAQSIFNTALPEPITAYLTINNRCPYNITESTFYVSFPRESVRKTIMHELWHFYTWYGLGVTEEERLGKGLYNDLKESLTVLLNVVCADLMPEGVHDEGYLQHQLLRAEVTKLWNETNDITNVWRSLTHLSPDNQKREDRTIGAGTP